MATETQKTNDDAISPTGTNYILKQCTPKTPVNITQQFRKKENMRQDLIIKNYDYLLTQQNKQAFVFKECDFTSNKIY